MQLGSAHFETYNRTLRRIMWAEFIDEQLKVARENQYKASIVDGNTGNKQTIAAAIGQARGETTR